ncbi:hypothetical protein PVK06_033857 [Gossypium arboreum]|uniref:Uncharacterized protein n=1 Tax=Gossypium arboreum TaxID=29729 RepID=A0ABR0NFH7_GOSAR|nr:hypothetical protein PVK06_033857 [Gossypium arboreum]
MESRTATYGAIFYDHERIMLVGFTGMIGKAFDAPLVEALFLYCVAQKAIEKDRTDVLDFGLDYPNFIHQLVLDDIS